MNARDYILCKQIQWATNCGKKLIGSQGERGRPSYVCELNENLFQPMSPDVTKAFEEGDGNELAGKTRAVHSSSALAVNVFQYWMQVSDATSIAVACGLCRAGSSAPSHIVFEGKYPVFDEDYRINGEVPTPPNIDAVIHNHPGSAIQRLAIECKFSEAYGGRKPGGIAARYLNDCDPLWADIPNLRELALSICPDDHQSEHLHRAQLIKHILGLKRAFGRNGFRLLYLWYDVLGPEGSRHRAEIDEFAGLAKADKVKFHSLSYQELICHMAAKLRPEHDAYIRYLTQRYL